MRIESGSLTHPAHLSGVCFNGAMRFGAGIIFFAVSFVFLPGIVRAETYIQNDSSFIDFSSGSVTLPPGGSGSSGGDGQGGSPSETGPGTGTGESGSTGAGGATGGTGSDGTSAIGIVTVGSSPGGGVDSGTSGASQNGGNTGGDEEAAAEGLFGTLVGNQAVTVKGGAGNGSGDAWSVSVNGDAVRRSLKARGIGKVSIPGFDDIGDFFSSFPLTLRTGQDFAIVAASTALKNPGIEEISLTLGTLHIAYRARGNLFAFLPLIYRIRIDVNPDERDSKSRIAVKFPWYKFFLQTYVSKQTIESEVEAAIATMPKDTNVIDSRAHLLARIADSIQARFDTVEESLSAR